MSAATNRTRRWGVAALFVAAGGLAGLDVVVLARMLGLYVGHAATAHAVVVSTYMAGLGWGYLLGGRGADQAMRPLRRYALLELGVGIWVLLFPWLLSSMIGLVPADWTSGAGSAALCSLLLLPPTVAMGATLPALVSWWRRPAESSGQTVARLYALNSAGAACGGLFAGFVALERFGLSASLRVGGVGALLLAVIALGLSGPRLSPPAPDPEAAPLRDGKILWAAGLVGAAALALQVMWFRLFGLVLGTSAYAFCMVVAAVIAGVALGAALVSGPLKTRDHHAGERWSAWLLLAAAGTLLLTGALYPRLPWLLVWLRQAAGDVSFATWWTLQGLLVAALVVPASALMGAVLPSLTASAAAPDTVVGHRARVRQQHRRERDRRAFGGTLLLPVVGLQGVVTASLLLVVTAVLLRGLKLRHQRRADAVRRALNAALGRATHGRRELSLARQSRAVLVAMAPTPPTRADGLLRRRPRRLRRRARARRRPGAQGQRQTRRLDPRGHAHPGDQRLAALHLQGRHRARLGDRPRQRGDGGRGGEAVQRVEVVEISPAVIDAASHFAPWNHDATAHLPIHRDDARAWLQRDRRRWDVIISEPSNPWVAGNGALFTREFFQQVRGRLRAGGVLAQWFHFYEMDEALLRLVLRTVTGSFRHVSLWTLFPGDLLMLASDAPLSAKRARLQAAMDAAGTGLRALDVSSPEALLSLRALAPGGLRARLNSHLEVHEDDRPILELRAPRALYAGRRCQLISQWDQRAVTDAPLGRLRQLARLHVRFPAAPQKYRDGLLSQLALKEGPGPDRDALAFTLARLGPEAAARAVMTAMSKDDGLSRRGLRALAALQGRLGEDPRPALRRCLRMGDEDGACQRALRGWRQGIHDAGARSR